jgi:hypothetical protein
MTHSLAWASLFVLGGAVAFVLAWYLLGMGVGLAQRGYNRVAPYKIQTKVVEPTTFQRDPYTWEEWGNQR